MAYSSVRVQFEIGHEASVRTKKTPEGFTHDWEVFVRGADNTDIQCFVDKVVFHLHETFPKPRRVIKEPPYIVKESGYAGFVLPIDVYLKNKEEPKKISFQYDLTLQSSGPPISRVLREPRLFQNPSEDFRRKLIRGGGVGVDTPSEPLMEDLKTTPSISQNKSKPAESPVKKHKPDQLLNHSFADLFGTPIRRVPEPKKLPEPPKKVEDKKKSSKPYRDEKEITKEKYIERDKSKERLKRPPSPSLPPPPAPQIKPKDEHKKHEDKKKEEEKKKRKEEKDKKDKAKEPDRQPDKEFKKEKKENRDGDYAKKLNSKPPDAKSSYEKHNSECLDKEKERIEKEKHKHRHKKKEKEKNRDKEKHRKDKEKDVREKEKEKASKKKHEEAREKEEKRRKSRTPSPPVHIKKGPLNALLDELGSSDSASPLSDEDSIPPGKSLPKLPAKVVPDPKPQPLACVPTPKSKSTNSNEPMLKIEEMSLNKNKKEKSSTKKSKKIDKDLDRKKEKQELRARSVSSEREEEDEEQEKEKVKDRPEKERLDIEDKPKPKDKENRKRKRDRSEEKFPKSKKSEGGTEVGDDAGAPEELRRPDKFTKEYVAQLKDLQHRIMTLEDNAELQKVVKVIAETGQYEVTKKTFDFDLCALDMETVKRLQEFFAPT